MNWIPPEGVKVTLPSKGLKSPEFVFKRGSDVQALWREHGWTPPSERMAPPPPERIVEIPLRRIR